MERRLFAFDFFTIALFSDTPLSQIRATITVVPISRGDAPSGTLDTDVRKGFSQDELVEIFQETRRGPPGTIYRLSPLKREPYGRLAVMHDGAGFAWSEYVSQALTQLGASTSVVALHLRRSTDPLSTSTSSAYIKRVAQNIVDAILHFHFHDRRNKTLKTVKLVVSNEPKLALELETQLTAQRDAHATRTSLHYN